MRVSERATVALVIATLMVVCFLVFDPLDLGVIDYLGNCGFNSTQIFGNTLLGSVPTFILHTSKNKRSKISIFKGREAKLNRAILLTLFQNNPLVIYDITKEVKKNKGLKSTKYSNVNRRVRALTVQGYLKSVGTRPTITGDQGILYKATIRAKVAFYNEKINPDQFIKEASNEALTTQLAAMVLFLEEKNEYVF